MTKVLTDISIVDPVTRSIRTRRNLFFANGRFAGDTDADTAPPADAETIDGAGAFVIPGFIDAHIHLRVTPHVGPRDHAPTPSIVPTGAESIPLSDYVSRAQTFLYSGVTSVFDAGNDPDVIFGVRELERAGTATLPRVFATGNLFCAPGGHGCSAGVEIGSVEQIPSEVAAHSTLDPDLVKITHDEHGWGVRPLVPHLNTPILERLIEEIHATGKKVTVHVSNELRAREAIAAGADILAHPVIQSPMNESFATEIAEAGIPVVSTLTIGDRYPRLADDPSYLDGPLYRDCETAEERKRLQTEESEVQKNNHWADWMRTMTPIAQENLRMLAAAGATIGTGTDQAFGPDYHRELELLGNAGLSEWDVVCAATSGAARAVDQADSIGSFGEGTFADFLLLPGNPIADMSVLGRFSAVYKGGEAIDRSALDLPVNRGEA